MRPSTRTLSFGVALGALVLSALAIGGAAVALRQLAFAREAAATRAQDSLFAALVDGVANGDWAILAQGVSPRLTSLTLERVADLVSVLDARGAPLLQVPGTPPAVVSDAAAISSSSAGLTVLDGQPYVAAAVPVISSGQGQTSDGGRTGFVVVARKLA